MRFLRNTHSSIPFSAPSTCLSALLFLALLLALLGVPAFAGQKVTIVGDNSYFPYSYSENGANKGIYYNVLTEAFSELKGYDVTIKLEPWKRGINSLKSGSVFALYPPYYRPKSRPWMNTYSVSLFDEVVVVVCNKDRIKGKTFKNFPKDYKGISFGNNSGYQSGGEEFMAMVSSGDIQVTETKDTKSNLKKLKLGRVDCYINDRLAILAEANKLGDTGWMVETNIIATEQSYLGFSKVDGKFGYTDDFIEKFNKIINAMKKAGRIEVIVADFLK